MAKIVFDTSSPNDGLGTELRNAFIGVNSNFTELYDNKVDKETGKGLSTNDYTNAERDKLAGIEEEAQVNVQSDWAQNDNTQYDYIKNKPTLTNYVNTIGFFDYNNSNTTPLTLVANTEKKLTNDCVGAYTDISHPTYGVTRLFDPTINNIVLNELGVGDLVKLRVDINVTTATANQNYKCILRLGIGTSKEFEIVIHEEQVKDTGLHKKTIYTGFYVGSDEVRASLGELVLLSDHAGSVVVNGFFFEAVKRNVNFVELSGGGGSQDLQQTLNTGATATFTHPLGNETFEIKEVDDVTIGYRSGKSFTQSDGNISTYENIALGVKTVNNIVTNGDIQSVNASNEYGLSTTESEYNQIRVTQISNNITSEQGNTTYEIPTPKLGVNVVMRDPIIETSGTYTRATQEWVTANPPTIVVDADDVTETATRVFITPAQKTAITHSNRSTLDLITEAFTTALKSAYDNSVSWITTNGTNVLNHLTRTDNPHNVNKSQVGLGNADNTSDINKPVSTAQATAIGLKQDVLTDVNFGSFINSNTAKTTIVDADSTNILDSVDSKSKKVTWTNIKAFLKTYFDTLYVNRTSWIDISATSTIVGFSSFTTKQIYYKKISDNVIWVKGRLTGTSNSGLVNFTIPFTSANNTQNVGNAFCKNNGVDLTSTIICVNQPNSNVVSIFRDNLGAAFTASGTKDAIFSILIEIQ